MAHFMALFLARPVELNPKYPPDLDLPLAALYST